MSDVAYGYLCFLYKLNDIFNTLDYDEIVPPEDTLEDTPENVYTLMTLVKYVDNKPRISERVNWKALIKTRDEPESVYLLYTPKKRCSWDYFVREKMRVQIRIRLIQERNRKLNRLSDCKGGTVQ